MTLAVYLLALQLVRKVLIMCYRNLEYGYHFSSINKIYIIGTLLKLEAGMM